MRRLATCALLAVLLTGCLATGKTGKEAEQYIRNHDLSEKTASAIRGSYVYVGMPADHLTAAIGNPVRVNTSKSKYGTRRQLIYKGYSRASAAYVYVEGGEIVSIQEQGFRVTRPY